MMRAESAAWSTILDSGSRRSFDESLTIVLEHHAAQVDLPGSSYVRDLVGAPSSRFRPRLLHAVASARGDADPGSVLRLAAAVELLHTASLIHDDYVDASTMRRGHATPRHAMGDEQTLLLGIACALRGAIIALDAGHEYAVSYTDACVGLGWGQLNDVYRGFQREAQQNRLVGAISKTGSLMRLSLRFGWAVGSPSPDDVPVQTLDALGADLGMCFQACDDAAEHLGLDLAKSGGLDARNGLGQDTRQVADLLDTASACLLRAKQRWDQLLGEPAGHGGGILGLGDRVAELRSLCESSTSSS